MKFHIRDYSLKTYVLISILIMSVPGILEFGYQNTIPQMALAVLASAGLDLLVNKLRKGPTYFVPTSGIISGLIISGILSPGSVWYIPVLGGVLASFSKHAIKIKINNSWNHIFNPANFALFVLVVLGIGKGSWWIGASPIFVLVLGLFILWEFKKIPLIVAPFFIFFLLSTSVTLVFTSGSPNLLASLGGSTLFFMFIMIQEPMTSPRKKYGKIVFGSVVGVLAPLLLAIPQTGFASIYLSLLIGNLLVPVLNRM